MVRRLLLFVCLFALFAPAVAAAQTTALFFDSQPGDYIGRGKRQTWTEANLKFDGSVPFTGHVKIHADNFSFMDWKDAVANHRTADARRSG